MRASPCLGERTSQPIPPPSRDCGYGEFVQEGTCLGVWEKLERLGELTLFRNFELVLPSLFPYIYTLWKWKFRLISLYLKFIEHALKVLAL